jgi:hypothetical protein
VWPALLIPVVVFPAVWLGVCLFGSLGGWGAVARAYPAPGPPPGRLFRFRALEVRAGLPFNYSGVAHAAAGPDGLYFSVFTPFRPFHPPILVPWSDVRTEAGRVWYGSAYVDFRFDRCPGVRFRVSDRLAAQLAAGLRTEPPSDPPAV